MAIVSFAQPYEAGATRGHSESSTTEGDRVTHFYWTKLTHVGLCLHEREANFHDDSDFYMTVWNEQANAPEEIQFATTRGWTYPCMASRVDATDEVRAKYNEWKRLRGIELQREADAKEKARPRKGKSVKVVSAITRGKNKVAVGEHGVVFWEGDDCFAGSRYRTPMQDSIIRAIDPLQFVRVGVKLSDGRSVFLNAKKVEVV